MPSEQAMDIEMDRFKCFWNKPTALAHAADAYAFARKATAYVVGEQYDFTFRAALSWYAAAQWVRTDFEEQRQTLNARVAELFDELGATQNAAAAESGELRGRIAYLERKLDQATERVTAQAADAQRAMAIMRPFTLPNPYIDLCSMAEEVTAGRKIDHATIEIMRGRIETVEALFVKVLGAVMPSNAALSLLKPDQQWHPEPEPKQQNTERQNESAPEEFRSTICQNCGADVPEPGTSHQHAEGAGVEGVSWTCKARNHTLGCNDYHLHEPPRCCDIDCWCRVRLCTVATTRISEPIPAQYEGERAHTTGQCGKRMPCPEHTQSE
jgi:hypothetical protein